MSSHVLRAFTVCYSVVYKRDAVKHNAFTDLSPFTEGGKQTFLYIVSSCLSNGVHILEKYSAYSLGASFTYLGSMAPRQYGLRGGLNGV